MHGIKVNLKYEGRRVTGVPPGLQNRCGADAPRMGSIPICPRQKKEDKR